MYQLYGTSGSGNCYKVSLLLTQLYLPFHWHEVDILKGESRSDLFLKKSRAGKVPILETPEGEVLSESNAILFYLAKGSDFLPLEPLQEARVLQWLFWEQYSHEPNIAVARFHKVWGDGDLTPFADKVANGYDALALMNAHLADNLFFVGNRYTIADIGLYAYTHVAHEGGFDMKPYKNVASWLERVSRQPGHIKMAAAK
ncbi:MAG: glutathione S-transferase family protein [Hahellaceae bacterium]|nr:glutathione S-transferase family protein [Hahellaceae bacterium]MCP5210093.1 glutathione S-transferase family protein [Hahellaceae bacterium]